MLTRPFGLEAVTCSRSTPSSKASLRTAGAASTRFFGGGDASAVEMEEDDALAVWVAGLVVTLLNEPLSFVDERSSGVSKTTRTSPTFATWPASTLISLMRPDTGEGISTRALSVSTSTIG